MNDRSADYIWPDIFADPDMPYCLEEGEHERRGAALADALTGWANVMAGSRPPATFGTAMAKLNEITGCATPDETMRAAKIWRGAN